MSERRIHDADGNLIRRTRIWRRQNGEVWFRHWMGDPLALVADRPATAREEARIVASEEGEETERYRRRLRRSVVDLLAGSVGNENEVVTVLVAAGTIPVRLARAAGWTPPGV